MAHDNERRQAAQGGANPRTEKARTGGEPAGKARAGKPSSQGLAGAQGSGGGAERGIEQPPPKRRVVTDQESSIRDNSGVRPEGDGADVSD
jgi:hypothetical protein